MLTHEFDDERQILFLKFHGAIVEADLLNAFALYEHKRFSAEHHVVYDTLGADISFTSEAFTEVEKRYGNRNIRSVGSRTAFVVDSGLKRGVASLARTGVAKWRTNWRFFATVEDACEWLVADDPGEVDFAPTVTD